MHSLFSPIPTFNSAATLDAVSGDLARYIAQAEAAEAFAAAREAAIDRKELDLYRAEIGWVVMEAEQAANGLDGLARSAALASIRKLEEAVAELAAVLVDGNR